MCPLSFRKRMHGIWFSLLPLLLYILELSFQLMADKNSQLDEEHKKTNGITKHFSQHDAVYEPDVGHTGTSKSHQKKNNHLHHAPEGGGGYDYAVSHRQAVEQFRTFLVNPVGYLPANRPFFPLKHTSGFFADGEPYLSAAGKRYLVRAGPPRVCFQVSPPCH